VRIARINEALDGLQGIADPVIHPSDRFESMHRFNFASPCRHLPAKGEHKRENECDGAAYQA